MNINNILQGKVDIIDNLINNNLQDYIFEICENKLSYTFEKTTQPPSSHRVVTKNNIDNIYDNFSYISSLKSLSIDNYTNINYNIGYTLFTPLYLTLSLYNIHISYENLIRCKVNCQVPTTNHPGKDYYNTPHIDFTEINSPYITLIYYVNNSDGDTVFFSNDGSIKQRIPPKKGSIVIFNGNMPHAASHPIDNFRYIISYSVKLI